MERNFQRTLRQTPFVGIRALKHNHRNAGAGMMLVGAVWVDGLL